MPISPVPNLEAPPILKFHDQVRSDNMVIHYSIRTETQNVYWISLPMHETRGGLVRNIPPCCLSREIGVAHTASMHHNLS